MFTIFNRKELLLTFDLDHLSKARSKLRQNHIDYYVRTVNRNGGASGLGASRRATLTTLGQKTDYTYEYHLYVHKKDFDDAMCAIHDIHNL